MLDTVFSFFSEQSPLLQQNEIEHFAIGSGSNYRNRGVSAMLDSPLMLPHETRSEWAERLGCSDQYSANTNIENYFRTQCAVSMHRKKVRLLRSKALWAKYKYKYHRTQRMAPRSEKSSYSLPTEDISFGRTYAPQDNVDDSYERYITRLEDIADDKVFAVRIASCTPESLSHGNFDEYISFLFSELADAPHFEHDAEEKSSAKDIIMPNVLCALLLEAKYRSALLNNSNPLNLDQLLSKYSPIKYIGPEASRYPLEKYPDTIKQLLGISKTSSGTYEIKSLFPELVAALVDSQGALPFRETKSVTKWTKNKQVLNLCLDSIKTHCKTDSDRYVSYYFIELLFRLNTKYRLFLGESHTKKENHIPPQALATIFYSSPLVYIPDKYISKCAYSQEDLRVFIKISHYWFPIIQTALRYYFEKNGAFNYAKIEEYLLPLCGEIDFPKSIDKLKDREERNYNQLLGDFVPPSGYNDWKSYYPYTINELKEKILSGSWEDKDRKILNLLCNSL